jgi:hypothetical protein
MNNDFSEKPTNQLYDNRNYSREGKENNFRSLGNNNKYIKADSTISAGMDTNSLVRIDTDCKGQSWQAT